MKKINSLETLAGLMLGAALVTGATAQVGLANSRNKPVQNVTVNVTSSGYNPSTVNVKPGRQVRMTFVSKGGGCANAVSIPALHKSFSLQPGQRKQIVFTPRQGQTITFACSMKMFKGNVVAR